MPTLKLLACALLIAALAGCTLVKKTPPPVAHAPAPQAGSAPVAGTIAAADVSIAADRDGQLAPDPDAGPVTTWKDITVKGAAPVANLWKRIRQNFSLPDGNERRVTQQRQWYQDHPGYMMRTGKRAKPYLYYIVEQLAKRGMPMDLALLPVVESAFNPYGYSYADASGLWQFIPSTGRNYGLKQNWWYDGRRDLVAATDAALDLLQDLHKRFDGNWLLALAAYNSGGVTVERAIARNKRRGEPTDFWHLDLPRQTRAYVPRLIAVRDLVAQPDKYGIQLPFVANAPYLARINLDGQIDIAIAAKMAGLSVKQMYLLNAGYSRWATPPDGPSYLLIPRDEKQDFLAGLDKMKKQVMAKWISHRIRRGETLSEIADRYHTSVTVLRHRNDIHGSLIRAGHRLMIPSPSAHVTRYVPPGATQYQERRGRPTTVRVRGGDTLWEIAQNYGVSVAQLASWNRISRNSTLHIGQRLKVWAGEGAPAYSGRGRSGPIVVRVHRGDSLWKLSRRYDVSVTELAGWNDISTRAVLHIGDRLKVWPGAHGSGNHRISYTVRNGDSLWSIANDFNVSLNKLADWNSISLSSIIHPGQHLTLFVDGSR
ncbi:MAG: LysM peptidoglycan-binding domain-containing protein [Gammaproteobacteria bacterium]|nr:LysM peptidoglycan-binding domain-containing protein [Gammaproteobacteria bacterium]